MPHQVWNDDTNAALLVIKHDRRPTVATNAKLKRSIGILVVEGLTLHTGFIVNLHVAMFKENDVGRILTRDALTYRAVTGVAIDGVTV